MATMKVIRRSVLQIVVMTVIFGAGTFLSAGTIAWWNGWVYIGLTSSGGLVIVILTAIRTPALLEQRSSLGGTRDIDRILAGVMALYGPLAVAISAGLDYRNGTRFQVPVGVPMAAIVGAILGSAITLAAMYANRFFYGTFLVSPESGHTVCHDGPYRIVRHPGYLGSILFVAASPILLESPKAVTAAAVVVGATVARTALEDRRLHKELEHYPVYARQVRWKLVPGLW